MNPDPTVDLIVQPDLSVRYITTTRELNSVHTQVGMPPARLRGVLGVHGWEGDEWSAVSRPRFDRGKVFDTGFVSENRAISKVFRNKPKCQRCKAYIVARSAGELVGLGL
jgi:hypothetical protein